MKTLPDYNRKMPVPMCHTSALVLCTPRKRGSGRKKAVGEGMCSRSAVPADRVIAVNIPVTVHKILHITAILFAVDFDLLEINCFCFGKQGEKFFRHVLCRFNVMRVFAPLKKREGLCQLLSCRFTFYWFIIIYHHKGIVFRLYLQSKTPLKYLLVNLT